MGLPQDNSEGYRIGSPIHFADGLRGKLPIVHGSGDANVHDQVTERLVNRLVELRKPFDLMVYPNRTHAIAEGDGTTIHVCSLIARYLLEQISTDTRPCQCVFVLRRYRGLATVNSDDAWLIAWRTAYTTGFSAV
jgi:dipeptidyl-peptidase-4